MPNILDRLAIVEDLLLSGPFGLIVDIDGTIAPIAPSPELASVTPTCKRSLRALSRLIPLVAAVSGRPAREARHLVGLPSLIYVGNHGLERWEKGKVVVDPAIARFRKPIEKALRYLGDKLTEPGVRIEDKGITLSAHYRQTADPEAIRQPVLSAARRIAKIEGLRVTEGRMVVDVRPPVDLDKGTAVMKLIDAHGTRSAIYLGDDTTDIDAFSALRRWRDFGGGKSLTVAVLSAESEERLAKEADAYANGVAEVERFLACLVELASE